MKKKKNVAPNAIAKQRMSTKIRGIIKAFGRCLIMAAWIGIA